MHQSKLLRKAKVKVKVKSKAKVKKAPVKTKSAAKPKSKKGPKATKAKLKAKKTVTLKAKVTKTKKAAKGTPKAKAKAKNRSKAKNRKTVAFAPYTRKKSENYMNESQREHFRMLLLTWKKQLMEEVDRTVSHMRDEAANYPDPADRASQEEEFSLELRTRDRERKLIKKIDNTIDLIDLDDYGYCESCGVEIGVRRLEARPTANQCIDCKTLDEIKERQILG